MQDTEVKAVLALAEAEAGRFCTAAGLHETLACELQEDASQMADPARSALQMAAAAHTQAGRSCDLAHMQKGMGLTRSDRLHGASVREAAVRHSRGGLDITTRALDVEPVDDLEDTSEMEALWPASI